MTDRIIRLDAAIATIMEYFPGNTINDPKYAAGKSLIEALSALPAVGGWLDIVSADSGTGHCLFYGATKHDGRTVFSGWVALNGTCYTDSGDICHPVAYTPLPASPEIE